MIWLSALAIAVIVIVSAWIATVKIRKFSSFVEIVKALDEISSDADVECSLFQVAKSVRALNIRHPKLDLLHYLFENHKVFLGLQLPQAFNPSGMHSFSIAFREITLHGDPTSVGADPHSLESMGDFVELLYINNNAVGHNIACFVYSPGQGYCQLSLLIHTDDLPRNKDGTDFTDFSNATLHFSIDSKNIFRQVCLSPHQVSR